MNETINKNTWPPEFDALIAAPRHHKLLFENDKVRVLETFITPGEKTEMHTHQWPTSVYYLSCSEFVRYNAEGTIDFDSATLANKPIPGSAGWLPPLPLHALMNTGQNNIHVISIEIKN